MTQATFRELEEESIKKTNKTVGLNDVREMTEGIAADAADEAGVEATPVGLVGDPADEIVSYASEHNASYTVVGGRRRSAVGKALFGSVTQSVLLDAEIPVVTVMHES
ncbi:universal stress protein [Halarchaeum acidiphilum MH1-52-1]|uniref:Universal stress protein n=2 Tax=Halarchaeum acidiphilum TaxID=489138 RepID=U2YGQ1_9EURY|nr:universal stress protein [Halarchaeum acidiphilum MH1-52-1]